MSARQVNATAASVAKKRETPYNGTAWYNKKVDSNRAKALLMAIWMNKDRKPGRFKYVDGKWGKDSMNRAAEMGYNFDDEALSGYTLGNDHYTWNGMDYIKDGEGFHSPYSDNSMIGKRRNEIIRDNPEISDEVAENLAIAWANGVRRGNLEVKLGAEWFVEEGYPTLLGLALTAGMKSGPKAAKSGAAPKSNAIVKASPNSPVKVSPKSNAVVRVNPKSNAIVKASPKGELIVKGSKPNPAIMIEEQAASAPRTYWTSPTGEYLGPGQVKVSTVAKPVTYTALPAGYSGVYGDIEVVAPNGTSNIYGFKNGGNLYYKYF